MKNSHSIRSFIFLNFISIVVCDKFDELPSVEELQDIKKPDLPEDFFLTLNYTAPNLVYIEVGSFWIESCAYLGAMQRIMPNPLFFWYGPNSRRPVFGHRFIPLSSGDMVFMRPTPKETGTYYCRLANNEVQDYFEEYVRSVIIFTPPVWIREIFLHFLVPSCSKKVKDYITSSAKKYLCKQDTDCLYQTYLVKCSSTSEFEEMQEARLLIRQYLHETFPALLPPNCGIECFNARSIEELETFSNLTLKELRTYMRLVHRETVQMLLQDKKTTMKPRPVCKEGYELFNHNVCVPCDIGYARHFNIDDQKCYACGMLSYSPVLGNQECLYCPIFKLTAKFGSTKSDDCIYFFQSPIALVLLIPLLVLLSLIIGFVVSVCCATDTSKRAKSFQFFQECFCNDQNKVKYKELQKKDEMLMQKLRSKIR
ncbi:hypothetical protein HELRODRAFT_173826 [Helobdella robusta]|uniref:Ig-like domain-containing protein n=1 Tax=Helobdella robusta TaxID=6412 RepID=T1F7A4_HELRO|nr:hypothetical protein HELRODRAFT_173826 [Helobdella robusta]ESO02991.1 hypothetical protein HELRODRAFT_173826 [Helobdella robusta]